MAIIAGKIGAVYMKTTDASTSFTTEATTANLAKTRFTITDFSKSYWDTATIPTVLKDGNPITTGFSIEYVGGTIAMDVALTTEVITVSGKHFTVSQVLGFSEWSLSLSMDIADVTKFEDVGWKTNFPTLKDYSVTAKKFWLTEEIFERLGEDVIISLYTDATSSKRRYEGYARIDKDDVEVKVDAVITESISFKGNGAVYYRQS